jgi:Integrator complex subunit 3 N-terminal
MEESLFTKLDFEILDLAFQEIEADYKVIRDMIGGKIDESEVLASLQTYSLTGRYDGLAKGLMYGCLLGHNWINYLLLTSRDNFKIICSSLALILSKLKSTNKAIDLLFSLIKTESPAFSEAFLQFLRTLPLIKQIRVKIDWVISQSILPMIFYKLLRQSALENDTEKAEYINVISYIWKKRKDYCLSIGRDLVRLISALAEVSGTEDLWNDLFSESKEGEYPVYMSLLCTPTNPKFQSMLLPPILESKLIFIIEHSPQQSFSKYLKWLMESYSVSLIPDMVRFIVTYAPIRETTPRWQIVAWMLTYSSDHQIQANIKQALVFDCLFFGPSDQVHSIEPMLSLIKFSLNKYMQVAEELLEFVLTSAELYDKRSTPTIMKSLKEVFSIGYLNGFFPDLSTLCSNDKIDTVLRSRLSEINEINLNDSLNSPAYETEDSYINTKRVLMDNIGEQALKYASEPSYDGFLQIISKHHMLGEELYSFLMKAISHEYTLPLSLEINRSQILVQIFEESENNTKISDFLKYVVSVESSIGVRFLIYSFQSTPELYFKYSDKLERDIRSGMEDFSLQCLNWIFRKLFSTLSVYVTPAIIHFFLQIANADQIYQVELDVCLGYYTIIGNKLSVLLEKSSEFSTTEQIYLWKLIQAEVSPENLDKILEAFNTALSSQWEALSGLLNYLLSYIDHIKTDHVKVLLSFPARTFKSFVIVVLEKVSPEAIEEAISYILLKTQFQAQINLLKHLKLWIETEGKLADIVKTKSLQSILSSTLHSLSSDYFTEFNKLLEPKQLFPR